MELKISKFLRVGVLVSAALMLIGWLPRLKMQGNPFLSFTTYDPIPLQDLLEIHLKNNQWWALISYLGLFVLISLPIIRVTLTGILFYRRKEFLLSGIAFVVLIGLMISFSLGAHL